MEIDRRRHVRRVQAARPHALEDLTDHGFVRNRRMREVAGAWRLGRVVPRFPMHAEHTLRVRVPGLQLGVADRPGHRRAIGMLDPFEIPLPEAEHRRAVYLGVAADVVELPGTECVAGRVEPSLGGSIAVVHEHRFRVPVLRLARQALAALQDQNPRAAVRERERDRAPAYAGADDDDVEIIHSRRKSRPQSTPSTRGRKTVQLTTRGLKASVSFSSAAAIMRSVAAFHGRSTPAW